jgi:hypothetical protein
MLFSLICSSMTEKVNSLSDNLHISSAASEGVLLNFFTHTIVVVIMGAGHFLYCGNP